MRVQTPLNGGLVLALVAAGLAFLGCGTSGKDGTIDPGTTPTTAVATQTTIATETTITTGTTGETESQHWEGEGLSLDWPAGWDRVQAADDLYWPPGRLMDCSLLAGSQLAGSNDRIEVVRVAPAADGGTLQGTFDEAYARLVDEWGDSLREVNRSTVTVGGLRALVQSYEIPHGEPYYECQDVWLEYDGSILVLAARGGIWGFDQDVLPLFETVIQSVRLGGE